MKILSISIAAYNVEHTLPDLIESIIESGKIDDIEVIIVNDGSKDNTKEVALKYQQKYPESIVLINKENGGHGSTINTGIDVASGKFFKVIDGDDWVDPNNFSILINKLKSTDCDLILCDFVYVYEGTKKTELISIPLPTEKKLSFEEAAPYITDLRFHQLYFKLSILKKNIRIQEKCFYVDNELDIYPLKYIDTVVYYNISVYCYRLGREGQSVSRLSLQKNIMQRELVIGNLLVFFETNKAIFSENKKKFIASFISDLIGGQLNILFSFPLSPSRLRSLIRYDDSIKSFPEVYKIMNIKKFLLWRKARIILYLPVWVYCKLQDQVKAI